MPTTSHSTCSLNGQSFVNADACVIGSNALSNGTSARIICFRQSSFVSSLLLSDMDGTIPPAQGAPAFFATFGPNSLRLWKFHVDVVQPSNSLHRTCDSAFVSVRNSMFLAVCWAARDHAAARCSRRPPHVPASQHKFADGHESLYFNHSVTTGVRWYEIQNPNGTAKIS